MVGSVHIVVVDVDGDFVGRVLGPNSEVERFLPGSVFVEGGKLFVIAGANEVAGGHISGSDLEFQRQAG